jgi:hypothetical protein
MLVAKHLIVREVGIELLDRREGVIVRGGDDGSCTLPPGDFHESDLVGTWIAGNPHRMDTLILAENGLYRQLLNVESPQYSYESGWQQWWVEYQDEGPPYLHLEGMQLCVYSLSANCDASKDETNKWYDFCMERIIQTHGEGILLVLGVPDQFGQPVRGIELTPMTKDPDTGGWVYQLQP